MDVARKLASAACRSAVLRQTVLGTKTAPLGSSSRQFHDSSDAMVSLYKCSPSSSACVDLTAAGRDEGASDAYRGASNVSLKSATLSSVPDPYVSRAADDDVTVPPSESQPVNRWQNVACQMHDAMSVGHEVAASQGKIQ